MYKTTRIVASGQPLELTKGQTY